QLPQAPDRRRLGRDQAQEIRLRNPVDRRAESVAFSFASAATLQPVATAMLESRPTERRSGAMWRSASLSILMVALLTGCQFGAHDQPPPPVQPTAAAPEPPATPPPPREPAPLPAQKPAQAQVATAAPTPIPAPPPGPDPKQLVGLDFAGAQH